MKVAKLPKFGNLTDAEFADAIIEAGELVEFLAGKSRKLRYLTTLNLPTGA